MDKQGVLKNIQEKGLLGTIQLFFRRRVQRGALSALFLPLYTVEDRYFYRQYNREKKKSKGSEKAETIELSLTDRPQKVKQFQEEMEHLGITQGEKHSVLDFYYTEPLREQTILMVGLGKMCEGIYSTC